MSSNHELAIEDLGTRLEQNRRLLGLDVGSKTIGLALSDVSCTIATPLETIKRKKFSEDLVLLTKAIEQHDVFAIVIGMPKHMDGGEGRAAQSVRAFARNLAKAIPLPIVFWDERLSTVAVERTLLEADSSRKRRKEVVDKMAAAFILQGALDRLRQLR